MGIKCRMFAPPIPFISTHYNNRDHRKIMVIDGRVAFTGGVNLSDEYINVDSPFGHWKDVGIMLQGDGVYDFTLMFLQMWKQHIMYLNNEENRILAEMRDALLNDLMTGKIEVV